jgi:hypothetical protein
MKTVEEAWSPILQETGQPTLPRTIRVPSARGGRGDGKHRRRARWWRCLTSTCEEGHIWIERSRKIITDTGYDGQAALLRTERAGGEGR